MRETEREKSFFYTTELVLQHTRKHQGPLDAPEIQQDHVLKKKSPCHWNSWLRAPLICSPTLSWFKHLHTIRINNACYMLAYCTSLTLTSHLFSSTGLFHLSVEKNNVLWEQTEASGGCRRHPEMNSAIREERFMLLWLPANLSEQGHRFRRTLHVAGRNSCSFPGKYWGFLLDICSALL